ncbi:MAG: hypothetical protein R3F17_09745 [Planctomycetota bacterium]
MWPLGPGRARRARRDDATVAVERQNHRLFEEEDRIRGQSEVLLAGEELARGGIKRCPPRS